jgi:predicted ATP-dependent serine protease
MDAILQMLHELHPKAVILDSIQTVSMAETSGSNGSVSQVRECTKALVTVCKQTLGIPVFLVGHVTKQGDIAGPKTLEHIVDTVLYLEGEEGSQLRLLRANKNRYTCNTGIMWNVTSAPHGLWEVHFAVIAKSAT